MSSLFKVIRPGGDDGFEVVNTAGAVTVKIDGTQVLAEQQVAIADLVDALDGVALGASSTLTTSATPTVDELESCVGVLGGKINAILAMLRTHGIIAT